MNLRKTLSPLLGALTLTLAAIAAKAEAPFQFGFFAPDLQLVDASEDVRGLRINFVYGENRNVTGADLGIVNSTTGNSTGFAWGPGVGLVDGDTVGVQWHWLYARTGGEFTGWQSAFLLSRIDGTGSSGLQTSPINLVDADFTGLQLGLFNRAGTVKGLQLGLVNWAETLDGGLQLGFVNYAGNSDITPWMPLVNWQF